jgi:integrase
METSTVIGCREELPQAWQTNERLSEDRRHTTTRTWVEARRFAIYCRRFKLGAEIVLAFVGEPLNRHVLPRWFHTTCRVLGWDRLRTLTIHHGRHTFISNALAGEPKLAEVKAAADHASLLTTSVYLHVVVDERDEVGECIRHDGMVLSHNGTEFGL